jgi:hypothetical protein
MNPVGGKRRPGDHRPTPEAIRALKAKVERVARMHRIVLAVGGILGLVAVAWIVQARGEPARDGVVAALIVLFAAAVSGPFCVYRLRRRLPRLSRALAEALSAPPRRARLWLEVQASERSASSEGTIRAGKRPAKPMYYVRLTTRKGTLDLDRVRAQVQGTSVFLPRPLPEQEEAFVYGGQPGVVVVELDDGSLHLLSERD